MSKILSLKLKNEIFEETESILKKTKRPRNAYINEAIHFYNRLFTRKMLRKQLLKESAMVAEDSMAVLNEFEKFEEGLLGEAGLIEKSDMMVDQLRTIDNRRFIRRVGAIGRATQKRLAENIKIILT